MALTTPHNPHVINPLLQILQMESGDGGTAGAVAVAMLAKKKQEKRAPGGCKTFKVLNNFGPAGHRNPPRTVKFDSGICEPELAGETPSPHKKARGKEASFFFRPNPFAAAKGKRDVEAKAVAEDDSNDIEAKAVAKDDSDDNEGAIVRGAPLQDRGRHGRPRRCGCDRSTQGGAGPGQLG
jgi:hypothetical protein